MDWEDYPRHEENRRVIDAAGKVIAGILTAALVATFLVWAWVGWYDVLPMFAE